MNNDHKDFKDASEVTEFLMKDGLAEMLPFRTERQGDNLYLPELDALLRPVVQQAEGRSAGIAFYLKSKKLDKQFYEYCAGGGKDLRTAVGMATGSFVFGFMDGLQRMYKKDEPRQITTGFAGKLHKWNVYLSNVVGMGDKGDGDKAVSTAKYWELLESEISKRLGNQKNVYVKVYASKYTGDTIGEVRFDDVVIPELSRKVKELTEKWGEVQFASEKQFIFIEQSEETRIPSEYDGEEGFAKMRAKVLSYLKLYHAANTKELYDRLYDDAMKLLDDKVLVAECFAFLPEMAAKQALGGKLEVSDCMQLLLADGTTQEVYESQLTDYEMLDRCLGDIIRRRDFGAEAQKLWLDLGGSSAICSVLDKANKQGARMEDLSAIQQAFVMREEFELR